MWDTSIIDGPISISGSEGYHVNIPLELLNPDLRRYVVEPKSPRRVLSQNNTVYLKFTDEDQARRTSLGRYWIKE